MKGSTVALTDSSGNVVARYSYTPYGSLTCGPFTHPNTSPNSPPCHPVPPEPPAACPPASSHSPAGPPPCLTRAIQANHFLYDGQYQDTISGLYYLRARWYDPATGQFTSVDALVDITGAPYSYAGGNPANGGDPMGLCSWYDIFCGIGNLFGGGSSNYNATWYSNTPYVQITRLSQPYDTPGGQLWVYGPFYKQLISDYNAGTLCHASTLSSLLGTLYNGVYANGSTSQQSWLSEIEAMLLNWAQAESVNPYLCGHSSGGLDMFTCVIASVLTAKPLQAYTNHPSLSIFQEFAQETSFAGYDRPMEGSIAFMIYIMNGSFTDLYQDAINLLQHKSG